jgi:hypothetical protein
MSTDAEILKDWFVLYFSLQHFIAWTVKELSLIFGKGGGGGYRINENISVR